MGKRGSALGVGLLLLFLTGCSGGRAADAQASPALRPEQPTTVAAAAAGGPCIMWDYALIEEQIGVLFDVAAANRTGTAASCVVQSAGAARPDLSLSVVESTEADAAVFTAELMPPGATKVKKLGVVAYRRIDKASGDHGPVIELGWLSADKQLMIMRFTFAVGASPADAETMAGRMVALARAVNGDVD